jgi:hypothetical protein
VTLAAGAVALAGCGGGTLSHGGFVKRADAICSAYRAGAEPLPKARSYEQVGSYVDRNLPLYEAALRKLEALHPPARDKSQVDQWLAADRRVAGAVRALGRAALNHNFPGVTAATTRLQVATLESSRAAGQLGLQVCGKLITSGR